MNRDFQILNFPKFEKWLKENHPTCQECNKDVWDKLFFQDDDMFNWSKQNVLRLCKKCEKLTRCIHCKKVIPELDLLECRRLIKCLYKCQFCKKYIEYEYKIESQVENVKLGYISFARTRKLEPSLFGGEDNSVMKSIAAEMGWDYVDKTEGQITSLSRETKTSSNPIRDAFSS